MPLHERQMFAHSSQLISIDSCKIRPEHPNETGQNSLVWMDTQKDESQIFFNDSHVTSKSSN